MYMPLYKAAVGEKGGDCESSWRRNKASQNSPRAFLQDKAEDRNSSLDNNPHVRHLGPIPRIYPSCLGLESKKTIRKRVRRET